jgi:hypothetical protein
MKKVNLIISALLLITIILSCDSETKEEGTDIRDKFVGTWTGKIYFSRIGTEYSITEIVTKSKTNSAQIIFTQQGSSSAPRIATVSGNSYVYQPFTATLGITGNYTGSGSINGNVLTETGLITSNNPLFQGDLGEWFRQLNKQ